MADIDTLTIGFDDRPEKVVTRQSPLTLREYFSVRDSIAAASWGDKSTMEAAYAAFAPFLISWDFDVPATAEGLAELDIILAMTILSTWRDEVRNVPAPLARRSSAGEPSPEA